MIKSKSLPLPLYCYQPQLCSCSKYSLIPGKASCKKINSFAVSEASLALSLAIVRPATEKTRSEGADVAGMQSNLAAMIDNSLYLRALYSCYALLPTPCSSTYV